MPEDSITRLKACLEARNEIQEEAGESGMTANLQQPPLLPLFDSGEADGFVRILSWPGIVQAMRGGESGR